MSAFPPPIRVVFQTVLTHSGELRLAGVQSARLPWLGDDAPWIDELRSVLSPPSDDDIEGWNALVTHLELRALERVRGVFDGDEPPEIARAALRVAVHAPGRDLRLVAGPRLLTVDFSEQMSRLAAQIDPASVRVDLDDLRFSLDGAQSRTRVYISPNADLLLIGLRVLSGRGEVLCASASDVFCPGGARTTVDLPTISASGLLTLSTAARTVGAPRPRIELEIHGLAAPISREVLGTEYATHLPADTRIADLFLDTGAANTRLVLRPTEDPERSTILFGPTPRVLTTLGVDQRYKSTGDLESWARRHLPAIAGWAATRHGTWLRDVVLGTEGKPPGEPVKSRSIVGDVVVHSEHTLVGLHLRPILAALGEAARIHHATLEERAQKIAAAVRLNAHLREVRRQDIERYEKSTGVGRVWADLGGDPRTKQLIQQAVPEPVPPAPLGLADLDSRLPCSLALDLGAASVEWALPTTLQGGTVAPSGADEVARRLSLLGPEEPSEEVRTEVDRAVRWMAAGTDARGSSPLTEALRSVYGLVVSDVLTALGWSPGTRSLVVLSGGSSADPVTRAVVAQLFEEHGIDARVETAESTLDALETWKSLGFDTMATPALTRSRSWARQANLPGDPFGLVEAMERGADR